ncbi:MAG TPA: hypothetical protein VKK79_08040 [Candidatus Lokiarchaeia archaeon]|nr:hypothetical protein [Candidatus Lokiarchaeia archaeon]
MDPNSSKFAVVRNARAEVIGIIISFGLLVWAIAGEYAFGVYGGTYFLPLFWVPVMHLLRLRYLDRGSFPYKEKTPLLSYDHLYPIVVVVVSIAAIPYLLAISDLFAQTTPLHIIYTGMLEHTGIHHGWVGWYFITEGYLYHRLNRHATKYRRLGEVWRNGLLIAGVYMFLDDFWAEQITAGALAWPDPFKNIEHLLPYSWDINFAIDIGVFALAVFIILVLNFYYRTKQGP